MKAENGAEALGRSPTDRGEIVEPSGWRIRVRSVPSERPTNTVRVCPHLRPYLGDWW
jgi:hypothetical protein